MELTYDILRIVIPAVVALIGTVASLYLSKNSLVQLRGFLQALRGVIRPYFDDTTDKAIIQIANEFNLTPEQVIDLLKPFVGEKAEATPRADQ